MGGHVVKSQVAILNIGQARVGHLDGFKFSVILALDRASLDLGEEPETLCSPVLGYGGAELNGRLLLEVDR